MWSKFKYDYDNAMILREIKTYKRTASGRWSKTPVSVKREIISPEYYQNYVTAVDFFNNWGDGASCRVTRKEYTVGGYVPTAITTISPLYMPDGQTKQVAEFEFLQKSRMEINAGWRELEIMKNATEWKYEDGCYHLINPEEDGVTYCGIYDWKSNTWRG